MPRQIVSKFAKRRFGLASTESNKNYIRSSFIASKKKKKKKKKMVK